MKSPSILRSLALVGWGPMGRVLCLVALAVAVVALAHGLGLRWDPFGLAERRLRAAEARAAASASDAFARRLEAEGLAGQARRLDQSHQQTVAVERVTAETTAQARSAHDASTPLDPARADRLLRHDRELCRLAPAVCPSAAPGSAAGGDPAVRAGPPA
ncbi:hypothetical protein [Brevundimonas sp.]|uniref:hypothetical protein n=1 Tax=Brevundimonas sp. TaxID=1871086 RepID=UPI002D35BFC8|nr:hypothetical protein [Brevundimonas sp.]HYD28255.1 hypothetical protein [Brevundimonas sp.]